MPTNPNPFLRSSFDAVASEPVPQVAMPELELDPAPAATPAAAGIATPPATPTAKRARKLGADNLAPPDALRAVFEGSAKEFDVPVNVLMAIAHQESRYDPQSVNPASGAKGIMNYMDATSGAMKFNPLDPNEAIPAAAMQIRERLDKGYSMADAVKEHFAGPDRAGWKDKTARYGDEVLAKAGEIGKLLYPEPAAQPVGPNENQFSPKLARSDYYANFVRINPNATPDAIQAVMAQYDVDDAKHTAAGGNRVQDKFAEMASPEAAFNARLNKKLQAGNQGVAQALPANAQPANPVAQESGPGERPGIGAQAAGDFGRGIDNLKALGYGVAGLAADATGHDAAADEYLKKYVAIENETARGNPATIGSYKKVHSLGDAGRYAIEAVFENLPMLLPSLVTGGVGVGIAKKAAEKLVVGMVEGQVAKGVAREVAEQQAAKFVARTILAGSAAGAAPATIGMESGSIMGDIYRETGKKEAGTALAYGIPAGLLDTLQPVMALRKIAGPVADQVAGGILKRLGVEAGKQFIVEAGTEGLQTIIEQAGVTSVSGKKLFTPELLDQVIDATLKGGIGGAGIGMASQGIGEARGAINSPARQVANEIERQVQEVNWPDIDEAARVAQDPNNEAVDPRQTVKPRGPLESAMHAAAPVAPAAPVEPAAAAAPAAGETFTIEGDDGTLHQLDAVTSTITPVEPAGPLVSAIGAAAESHAASPIAAPEIPQPPPEPPALESLAVDALHAELKRVATTIKESGRTAELVAERKVIEKEIGQRAKEARDATAKLAEEPTSLGPFATIEEANKMAPRVAEQSAVVHEVVKQGDKFILQPYKEPSDGDSTVLPEGTDDRSGSAGNAAGAGTADGAGHQGSATVPGVDRADAGRPVAKVQPDPVRAGAAADAKPALSAPQDAKPEWETNPYHARQFADADLAAAFMEKNKVDPAKFEAVQTGKARWKLQPKAEAPAADIEAAAHEAATSATNDLPEPTDAQKIAGNYRKGHISVQGLDITVENPRGSERSGTSPDGKTWSHTMSDHYGYIKRTEGADGEQVDIYVGPQPDAGEVFVVDQIDQPTGGFDEHKIMMGYADQKSAIKAYSSNFDKGWKVGPVTAMPVDEFKTWLREGDTTKPVGQMPAAEKVPEVAPVAVAEQPQSELQNIPKNIPEPKKRWEYPAMMGSGAGAIATNKGQKAVVDYMNGDSDKAGLIDRLGALDLFEGSLHSITNRVEDFNNGDVKKVIAIQQARGFNLSDDAPAAKKSPKAAAVAAPAQAEPKPAPKKAATPRKPKAAKPEPESVELNDIPSERTIEVDGVRRPISNSRGQLVAPTIGAQFAFWNFFKSSKAVDSRGKPLVLFHGTTADVESFKPGTSPENDGIFFTNSAYIAGAVYANGEGGISLDKVKAALDAKGFDAAAPTDEQFDAAWAWADSVRKNARSFAWEPEDTGASFANQIVSYLSSAAQDGSTVAAEAVGRALGVSVAANAEGANVVPAYLSLQNPLEIDGSDLSFDHGEQAGWIAQAKAAGNDGVIIRNYDDGGFGGVENYQSAGRHNVYIVFKPEQVKSATGNNGSFDDDSGHIALDLSSEQTGALMQDGPLARMEEPKRAARRAEMTRLNKLRGAGKITAEAYRAKFEALIGTAPVADARGPDEVRRQLLAAKESGGMNAAGVDFALWALKKRPALAADLAISIRATSASGTSGSYQSADRIMTLFASTANDHTAVHEMLHHTERMMPKAIQQGIAKAWLAAYTRATEGVDQKTRDALSDLLMSGFGDKSAFERTLKHFQDGTLEYDKHYQLVNASEYWAVNATRIMGGRFDGDVKGWAGKAKQWLKEMVEYVKGALGLRSDAPILKGLADVLNGTGARQSPMMLGQLPVANDVKFKDENVDYHHGQSNNVLRAMVNGKSVGTLEYTVYEGVPAISMVKVGKAHQRKGYAAAMVKQLQAKFPDVEIEWGMMTGDGAKLRDALPKTVIENQEIKAKLAELADVRAKLAALTVLADKFHAIDEPTEAQRKEYHAAVEPWNELHDREFDLESETAGEKTSTTLIQTGGFTAHDITAGSPPAAADDAATDADGLTPPDQGFLRRLQSTVQDNLNRVKQVQERIAEVSGAPVTVAADYYGAETNRPGRIAARLEDAQDKLTGPLMERLAKSGFKPEQLNELLHAMHAHERNEAVAKINPEFPDGGSGMTDEQANVIIERYKGATELLEMAQQARDIAGATLDLKRAYGLITADQHELLSEMYENYVPLKGDGEYGPKVKRAMGHGEREEFIMDNIARDYAQAVVVGEKNLARQSLLQMVLRYPDADLWTARVPPKGRYVAGTVLTIKKGDKAVAAFTDASQVSAFLEAKGAEAGQYTVETSAGEQVVEFTKPLQDNEVMVYVKGQPVRLQIHDEKLAAQLRPLDNGQMNVVLEFMRHVNRHLSKVYTGYNPSFIIRNTARDALTGTINMLGNEGAAITAKAWSNYPKALVTLIGWAHSKKVPAGRMGGYLTEYRDHGGKVGASWMSDLEQQGKSLTEMYDNARGLAATVRDTGASRRTATVAWNKTVGKLAHVIEVANQGTENALRLSLFVALRESGHTPGKAAQAAKGVTVDFDRKGTSTPALGAFYLFLNPAIQGTTNAGKTLFKGKHKGQAWAALGALSALGYFLAAAGMDDDRDRWLGESWEVRSKNFMYRAGEHQIKIPVSQEFAPFFALGMAMAEAGRGESKVKASVHVVSGFLDAYFPLNIQRAGSDNPGMDLVGGVVPTIVKPYFEIWSNRSSFGSVVVPESEFTKDRPDNLKMNRATKNSPYDKAAQGIAAVGEAVGARPYENDISKVSPETLKLLWRTYTGGLGTFIADSVGVAGMAFDGAGQITSGDVPIAKDFVRPVDIKPLQGRFYDLQRDTQRVITEFKQATKAGDGAAVQKIASDPDSARVLGLTSMITQLNKAAGQLSDMAVDVNARKDLTGTEKRTQLKEIDAQKEQLYRAGISAFKGSN